MYSRAAPRRELSPQPGQPDLRPALIHADRQDQPEHHEDDQSQLDGQRRDDQAGLVPPGVRRPEQRGQLGLQLPPGRVAGRVGRLDPGLDPVQRREQPGALGHPDRSGRHRQVGGVAEGRGGARVGPVVCRLQELHAGRGHEQGVGDDQIGGGVTLWHPADTGRRGVVVVEPVGTGLRERLVQPGHPNRADPILGAAAGPVSCTLSPTARCSTRALEELIRTWAPASGQDPAVMCRCAHDVVAADHRGLERGASRPPRPPWCPPPARADRTTARRGRSAGRRPSRRRYCPESSRLDPRCRPRPAGTGPRPVRPRAHRSDRPRRRRSPPPTAPAATPTGAAASATRAATIRGRSRRGRSGRRGQHARHAIERPLCARFHPVQPVRRSPRLDGCDRRRTDHPGHLRRRRAEPSDSLGGRTADRLRRRAVRGDRPRARGVLPGHRLRRQLRADPLLLRGRPAARLPGQPPGPVPDAERRGHRRALCSTRT